MRRLAVLLSLLLATLLLAACGNDTEDNAVEAQEQNTVQLGGVDYRVTLFRELNPRVEPDDALWDGPPPGRGKALYAAFVRACNRGGEHARPTDDIHLEDAFGQRYAPQAAADADFAYRPVSLGPGDCVPSQDSAAERTYSGRALIFEVPLSEVSERPFVLELRDGDEVRRVQLDV
jgi:hypothetical protein